jgi:DNA helicase II / ATP-dependent DNA helicase PcrA
MSTGLSASIEDLLAGLNEPQREAVMHADGPLLILAGPGSGKTRVVTRRVAYLARTVTKPWHILAITFTNKAAKEMRERIEALGVGRGPTVGTFHALCARLLRQYADRAGLPPNFTIMDRDDRRKLLKEAIVACDLSPTNYAPAAVERRISDAKNLMQTPAKFAESVGGDWLGQVYVRIYEAYEAILHQQGGLDFDDLLMRMALLLERDAELCEELGDLFRYVLVDEYQDTNAAQYRIARMISRSHRNLCVTGDPDQSIYGWRGADIQNILSFERDYRDARVVRLEQNYRSTKRILTAADALIVQNLQRKQKALWTENAEGPDIRVWEFDSAEDEALGIAQDIRRILNEGVPPSEVAILYRINALSRSIEEALIREGIPYQIARGVEFYNRKEIKDVLAYLRVLVNHADQVSLLRIINTPPRGIGDTTVQRLKEIAQQRGTSVYDVIVGGDLPASLGRSAGKVTAFAELLRSLVPALERPPAEALGFVMSHSGLRAHYRDERGVDQSASDNLDELLSAAAQFQQDEPDATLVHWLEHAALVSDVDAISGEGGPITLMTLHAAKGLEFNAVYIIGCEDGLLPFRRHDDWSSDDEEERRLCFVGMTRAKERLTLTHARYRMLRGQGQRTMSSPYLDELARVGVLEQRMEEMARPRRHARHDDGHAPDDLACWEVGSLVQHPSRGLGQIMRLERGAKRTHAEVLFRSGHRQSYVLEFAELERVDAHEVE